jgi:hypothetical protein
MIKWMVIAVEKTDTLDKDRFWYDPQIVVDDLSNIQTAEAERTMFLEDNPDVSPDNVSVIQYKE